MLGLIIRANGEMQIKNFAGTKELQEAVGGFFESVRPRYAYEKNIFRYNQCWQHVFICNEEGLLRGMDLNPVGSMLYNGDIAGDIVILKESAHEGFLDMTKDEIMKIVINLELLKIKGRLL